MIDYERINNTMGKMGYYLSNHDSICVSVSGGSDSDIIVHIIAVYFREHLNKIHFVFSNTGLEYKATLKHLDYLEERYNIKIERIRGKAIPNVVRKYGVPFLSKQVSEYMSRLQAHNFDFRDGNYDDLSKIFLNCQSALRWFTNAWSQKGYGIKSRFNISWNIFLREFLLSHNINFKVSAICCTKSKKNPLINFQKSVNCDLSITGERKAEKGARAVKNKCFERANNTDHFMPLFFWDDDTKKYYEENEEIMHSDCYTVYGLKRTGCVGCPFGRDRKEELEIMKKYEPNLYKACINVFGESYKFMDEYEEFKNDNIENRNRSCKERF